MKLMDEEHNDIFEVFIDGGSNSSLFSAPGIGRGWYEEFGREVSILADAIMERIVPKKRE